MAGGKAQQAAGKSAPSMKRDSTSDFLTLQKPSLAPIPAELGRGRGCLPGLQAGLPQAHAGQVSLQR